MYFHRMLLRVKRVHLHTTGLTKYKQTHLENENRRLMVKSDPLEVVSVMQVR